MQKPIALLIPFLFACETLYRARGKIVTAGDAPLSGAEVAVFAADACTDLNLRSGLKLAVTSTEDDGRFAVGFVGPPTLRNIVVDVSHDGFELGCAVGSVDDAVWCDRGPGRCASPSDAQQPSERHRKQALALLAAESGRAIAVYTSEAAAASRRCAAVARPPTD